MILLVLRTLDALGPTHGYGIARQAEYDEFQTGLTEQLPPKSETERVLAERIVAAA